MKSKRQKTGLVVEGSFLPLVQSISHIHIAHSGLVISRLEFETSSEAQENLFSVGFRLYAHFSIIERLGLSDGTTSLSYSHCALFH